jgi:hypothetical protein
MFPGSTLEDLQVGGFRPNLVRSVDHTNGGQLGAAEDALSLMINIPWVEAEEF